MKDNYERLREEYLNICDEDCGGDPSTGIQPCPFFEYEEGRKNLEPPPAG